MLYKISATFRCNNLRAAYNKRFMQKCNPNNIRTSVGQKYIKLTSNIITVGGLVTFLWQTVVYQRHSLNTEHTMGTQC